MEKKGSSITKFGWEKMKPYFSLQTEGVGIGLTGSQRELPLKFLVIFPKPAMDHPIRNRFFAL
jgi:hypothetical protein